MMRGQRLLLPQTALPGRAGRAAQLRLLPQSLLPTPQEPPLPGL
jgi:hypothetical protein